MKTRHAINLDTGAVPLDPDQTPLPCAISAHVDRIDASLRAEGFEPIADYALADIVPNLALFGRMFVNRAKQEVARASATCVHRSASSWHLEEKWFQFETNFSDGTAVVTTTNSSGRLLPATRHMLAFRFPWIQDVSRVHRVHRAIVDRFAADRIKELVFETRFGGDPMRYHAWAARRAYDDWQLRGYYYRDEQSGTLRLTFIGAILTVLYVMPPGRQLSARLRDRSATRLLRELNI